MMPLFKTEEFAELIRAHPQRVRDLVKAGFIRPALPGSKGQVHRFSGQQALAFAVVKVLGDSSRGCGPTYARRILDHFEAMGDLDLRHWVGPYAGHGAADMHDEEHFAGRGGGPEKQALLNPEAQAMPWDAEEHKQVCASIGQAWERVEAAIRERLATSAQRPGKTDVPLPRRDRNMNYWAGAKRKK